MSYCLGLIPWIYCLRRSKESSGGTSEDLCSSSSLRVRRKTFWVPLILLAFPCPEKNKKTHTHTHVLCPKTSYIFLLYLSARTQTCHKKYTTKSTKSMAFSWLLQLFEIAQSPNCGREYSAGWISFPPHNSSKLQNWDIQQKTPSTPRKQISSCRPKRKKKKTYVLKQTCS